MGAGSQTTAQFAEQVRVLRQALSENGRAGFPIAKRLHICVDDDGERGRRRIVERLERMSGYFGMSGFDALGIAGAPGVDLDPSQEPEVDVAPEGLSQAKGPPNSKTGWAHLKASLASGATDRTRRRTASAISR